LLTFAVFLWRITQAHARTTAVLVDEFDASTLECLSNGFGASLDTGLLDLSKSTIVESPSPAADASAG
jgi:hypothetical protein